MSEANSHGLNILVNPQEANRNKRPLTGDSMLVQWIMGHVENWEQWRDTNYSEKWDEYYRIWRCDYSADDKEREVERSRIMPTALSEAVNKTTAELSDAFFGRKVWFDVSDDPGDVNPEDVKAMGAKLRFDLSQSDARSEIDKCFLYGSLYGTGILKATVGVKQKAKATEIVDQFGRTVMGGATVSDEVVCSAVAVSPREFVIDPTARTVGDALGMAHIVIVPRHQVIESQQRGVYRKGDVPEWQPSSLQPYNVELNAENMRGKVELVEYHGLVPRALLPGSKVRDKGRILDDPLDESIELVEAIVTIANRQMELKAVENPFIPKQRSFFAYQHETVPDSFWGRGVIEAGYHPYKALQTEIRARADGLALANYPTVWRDEGSLTGDQTRDDPDEKIIVPGKEYLTSGNPNEAIREFKFSGPDRGSSIAIADYERMIEAATGSFGFQGAMLSGKDTSVAGSSVALQSFLRRSKRTALNIERDLLTPFIEATAWRSMQYKPERYPPTDFDFCPKGALGILQQDAERATMLEMLTAIPPESPAYYAVMQLIVESGPYEQRQELMAILDGLIAAALNPPPPPRDLGGEARLISAEQRIKEWEDEKVIRAEEFKRQDVELLLKAKGAQKSGDGGNNGGKADEVNINLNASGGKKRVVIKRTDEGLVGETEEMN